MPGSRAALLLRRTGDRGQHRLRRLSLIARCRRSRMAVPTRVDVGPAQWVDLVEALVGNELCVVSVNMVGVVAGEQSIGVTVTADVGTGGGRRTAWRSRAT